MANIMRRNTGQADPWKDFFDMGFFGGNRFPERGQGLPAVNISEEEKNFNVEVVAPGFKKDDFKINVDDDILTISAESKTEKKEDGNGKEYSRREYSFSSFTRSFRLPENAQDEAIAARYTDGILHITIPKAKEQQKATKQINIE